MSTNDTEPSPPPTFDAPLSLPGYVIGPAIGQGGMGEVLLAHDPAIGRDVAIKRMRGAASPELLERFLREAKIQARLDHPAIVPVYELGNDDEGRPYFSMKRLAGTTLQAKLAARDDSLQSLLRAYVDVCLAIDFAHARGVVHRDIKPENIILGEYGEVYVLDWGVARLLTEDPTIPSVMVGSDDPSPTPATQAGALLGTPGYMAPEQARGDEVTPAADIYALGAMLFEILAGEPLHPRGVAGIASTLMTPTEAPSARQPGRAIAPELDAACTAALAAEPTARPKPRELADRIQRYLDGDRDLARRRSLAADYVARARSAASEARQADAIRDAGRALALDPESAEAAALVMSLVLEPPTRLPAPLARLLDHSDTTTALTSARYASRALAATFLIVPLLIWSGVTHVWIVVAIFGLIAALAIDAHRQVRRGRVSDTRALAVCAIAMVLFGQALSPFVLMPVVIAGVVVGLGGQPTLIRRPWLVLATTVGAFIASVVLQATGVFARTWEVRDDHLIITSALIHLDRAVAPAMLIGSHVIAICLLVLFTQAVTAGRRSAARAIEIRAWQLRQLLPADG